MAAEAGQEGDAVDEGEHRLVVFAAAVDLDIGYRI
jgi:hypothetical protein